MASTLARARRSGRDRRLCRGRAGAAHADRHGRGRRAVRDGALRRRVDLDDRPRPRPRRPDRPGDERRHAQDRVRVAARSASRTAPAASGSPTARSTRSAGSTRARARSLKKIRSASTPTARRSAAGSVWVTSELDGTVRRISPKKNKVTATIKAGIDAERRRLRVRLALGRRPRPAASSFKINVKTNKVVKRISHREGGLDHAVARLAVGLERDRPRLPRQSRDRRGHRARRRRREPARLGVDQRRALGAEHRRRHDLDRRSGEERGAHDARRPARARSRSRRPAGDVWISVSDAGEIWRVPAQFNNARN